MGAPGPQVGYTTVDKAKEKVLAESLRGQVSSLESYTVLQGPVESRGVYYSSTGSHSVL